MPRPGPRARPVRQALLTMQGTGRHALSPSVARMGAALLGAEVITPYASRTGTKTTIEAMRTAGWRMLCAPGQTYAADPPLPYCIDNGAWPAFMARQRWLEAGRMGPPPPEFDHAAFVSMVERWGSGADWIALPDVVAGGLRSLAFSLDWLPWLSSFGVVLLLPVQDGIDPHHVAHLLGPRVGIFLGGSTEWKLSTMGAWGEVSKARGCHYHVARVNTADRIRRCQVAGAHSFDGTSVTLFSKTLGPLDGCRRQGTIPGL